MEKIVIVINGIGGVGKDTICDIVGKYYSVSNISSITPIKELAASAGWKGEKTLAARRLLSDLKLAFNRYNDLSYQYVMDKYNEFLCDQDKQILFVHIREPEEIDRFLQNITTPNFTLLVKSSHIEDTVYGNPSDDNVSDYSYDYIYQNEKPLFELENDFMNCFTDMLTGVLTE